MLLQTNSYVVPREKRAEHARLLRRFRSTLAKLGCDQFEAFEQVGANWNGNEVTGRYVQIMRFRDRKHQLQVQQAERTSPAAQQVIAEFCRLINFPYQQQQGLFAVGYYTAVLPDLSARARPAAEAVEPFGGMAAAAAAAAASAAPFGTSLHPVEEAPAEEAAVEPEFEVEEEIAATAVDLAEEPVEESYPAVEELPAEEVPQSDDGQAIGTLDEALNAADAADAAYGAVTAEEKPIEPPPPSAPVAKAHPAPAVVPPPPAPESAPVASPEPRRGLRPRKPIASAPPAGRVPVPPPAPAARQREVWSDDYTAPQGTAVSHPTPAAKPAPKPAVAKPASPAEAARGNGAATAPAFKGTTVPALTPKVPEPEVPAAPSAADQPAWILPEVEPVSEKVELPSEPVAPEADVLDGLDLVEEHAEERAPIATHSVAQAPVIAEAPVVSESPRPVAPVAPTATSDAPVPLPLPIVREEQPPAVVETASDDVPASSEALFEPPQHEAVPPAVGGDGELALDETPLALEPELVAEEDDFAWPAEAAEVAGAPAAARPELVEEAAIHEPADAARVELVNDEPLATEPPAAAIPAVSAAPVQPAEVIASEPEPAELEPEPLTFAGEPPAPARATVEPLAERPGGSSDLGLLAAESRDDDDAPAPAEDPFESLADALEISDDELDVPSDVPAAISAAQPARLAGSNGNGALSVTSAAKKSAAAFTDEDIDAALNEALRQLDGLDDLSEPAVPSRSRAAAR